jgi:hypothetical protein
VRPEASATVSVLLALAVVPPLEEPPPLHPVSTSMPIKL